MHAEVLRPGHRQLHNRLVVAPEQLPHELHLVPRRRSMPERDTDVFPAKAIGRDDKEPRTQTGNRVAPIDVR